MKKIAVLTSGGDAPGMNAAVKGVVRSALNQGWEVFGVADGYKGLVEGGNQIFPLDWNDVGLFYREGGTFLGSARFPELKGEGPEANECKKKALRNLIHLGISGLIVIGGDGSLKGAQALDAFLRDRDALDPDLKELQLSIIGVPGSIDNDIALTDMSIGVDTTLNTIVECIDKLRDTASSHKRVIIVEVMGRLRGYLAVMSGLASGADRIFIREEHLSIDELHTLLRILQDSFDQGQKAGVIVRSEGARFSTRYIKETIDVLLTPKREVRETVLGHLQRGGTPTSFERVLGLRMGVKAVETLQNNPAEAKLIVLSDNRIKAEPLQEALERIGTPFFKANLSVNAQHAFELAHRLESPTHKASTETRIGVLTEGENVSGMNMAIRAVARMALNDGMEVIGIKGGFQGLAKGLPSVLNLEWGMLEMKGILLKAGTLLGISSRGITEEDLSELREGVKGMHLDGLIVIGNSLAFQMAGKIAPRIPLPIVGIPATLNCDIRGTDWSIGMDSAANDLMKAIDRSIDTAHVKKRICIIHVKGDNCACLLKQASLAGGVDQWIIEEGANGQAGEFSEDLIRDKAEKLKKILEVGKNFATIILSSKGYDGSEKGAEMLLQVMREIGIDFETAVMPLETHRGGVIPTAFDRVLACRLGEAAFSRLKGKMAENDHTFDMVGMSGKGITKTVFHENEKSSDDALCFCSPALESELQDCFERVFHMGPDCVGLGGTIRWTDTSRDNLWEGAWTCKKCGHAQEIGFDPQKTLCVKCSNETCSNFGYIRSSRRF